MLDEIITPAEIVEEEGIGEEVQLLADVPPYREKVDKMDGRRKKHGLRLRMHPGQTAAWNSTKRFIALLAGRQSGKTCFGPDWLKREIDRCNAISNQESNDYLVVTATFPLLRLKLLKEFRELFENTLNLGTYHASDKMFTYHDGKTRVIFCSATNAQSVESATANAAWLDEAGQKDFGREAWEAIQGRLTLAVREGMGRVLITTTLYGYGWLKNEVYDKWEREGKNKCQSIDIFQFDSTINPRFSPAEFERLRQTLPPWRFNLFYRGRYEKPAGLIYDCFDPVTDVVPPFAIPESWPRYFGMDFGGQGEDVVSTAALWYALEPTTGTLYLYREYLAGGKSAAEHAEEFKEFSVKENIVQKYGGAHHEDGWREVYTKSGWKIDQPKMRQVEPGIDAVYSMHRQHKIKVFNDMYGYLDEKQSYSRKLDDNYEPTEGIDQQDKYHLMDAERSLMSSFDQTASGDEEYAVMYVGGRRVEPPKSRKEEPANKDGHRIVKG